LVNMLEQASGLDVPAKALAKKVRQLTKADKFKEAISGTWLGHPASNFVIAPINFLVTCNSSITGRFGWPAGRG
jgi:hypothetical protein